MLKREHLVVESRLEALLRVQRWFKELHGALDPEFGWVKHHYDRLNLAIAEGFTNAVRHAHGTLPPDTPIAIDVAFGSDRIDICIWDQGEPFDPTQLGEPEPGSLLQGGYGWFLLRRLANEVTYDRRDQQNCLTITQLRSQGNG